jgi:K+-transporting ATPase c subunit
VQTGYDGWTIEKHGGGGGDGVAEQEVRVVRMASNPVNCINPRFLDQLDATLGQLERENATSCPSPVVFASASGLDLAFLS